jgi:hypothetical protein
MPPQTSREGGGAGGKASLIQRFTALSGIVKISKRVNPYRLSLGIVYVTERIKPMAKSKDPKTYFEQVPLEIVKKIAKVEIPDDETNGADATVEPPAKK